MKIEYRKADIVDAELLIDIYNSSFYSDYVKYGECPAYGKTKEMMEKSIINYKIAINKINEKNIKNLLENILVCEQKHKQIIEDLIKKYAKFWHIFFVIFLIFTSLKIQLFIYNKYFSKNMLILFDKNCQKVLE